MASPTTSSPQIVMAGMANPELTSRLKDMPSSQQTLGIIDVATKLKVPVTMGKALFFNCFNYLLFSYLVAKTRDNNSY